MADVEGYGWHLVYVTDEVPWTYTVGMFHTLGIPEVALFGLGRELGSLLNDLGHQVEAGQSIAFDEPRHEILRNHPIVLKQVDPSWNRDLFGYAWWFYGRWPPFAQMVWPDRDGVFPWEAEYAADLAHLPRLWEAEPAEWAESLAIPSAEPPPHRWWPKIHELQCITMRRILDGEAPILGVVHDRDGDWQCLDGTEPDPEHAAVVHLAHLVDADPSLLDLKDLPRGWQAWRSDSSSPWERSVLAEADTE